MTWRRYHARFPVAISVVSTATIGMLAWVAASTNSAGAQAVFASMRSSGCSTVS